MRKFLLIFAAVFIAGTIHAQAASEGFITEAEAKSTAQTFIEAFNEIVLGGLEEEYADIWAYEALLDWKALLEEIGEYIGIGGYDTKIDADKAVVTVEVIGARKNAVVEFVLYNSGEIPPDVTMYSKFSLDTALSESGLGATLTVINSLALIVVIIVLLKGRGPAKDKPGEPIGPAVAGTGRHEELAANQELVAVIAAAIAASEGLSSAEGLVVRSIRKHRKAGLRRLA
jgi:hypothetical protein